MRKVLIIDDYLEITEMLASNLELQIPDIAISIAEDGVTGFGKCCVEKFDVIVTDYNMPGLNGTKAAKFIKESKFSLNKETPFILISAFIPKMQEKDELSFTTNILDKPFRVDALAQMIESIIGEGHVG